MDKYYLNPEHTDWAFNPNAQYLQHFRVEYIRVPIDSEEYRSAFANSQLEDERRASQNPNVRRVIN